MASSALPQFDSDVSFCPLCGTLLPPLPEHGANVQCRACRALVPVARFAGLELTYTVAFNRREERKKRRRGNAGGEGGSGSEDEADGPVVERVCPKCGYGKMSYAALQLRSADEGQTVFFTCLRCKYKESENS